MGMSDDKFKKILIVVIPILILAAVYVFFFDTSNIENNEREKSTNDGFESVVMPDSKSDTSTINKVDLYTQQENAINSENSEKERTSNLDQLITDASQTNSKPTVTQEEITTTQNAWTKPTTSPVVKKTYSNTPQKQRVYTKTPTKSTTNKNVNNSNTSNNDANDGGFYTSNSSTSSRSKSNSSTNSSTNSSNDLKDLTSAMVHGKHVLKAGQVIRIRLTENLILENDIVPKNTMISGITSFSAERVFIKISSIKLPNKIISCNLSIADYDGIEGIYIPGGINLEIAKNTAKKGASTTISIPIIGGSISTPANQKVDDPTVTIPTAYKLFITHN